MIDEKSWLKGFQGESWLSIIILSINYFSWW